MNIYADVDIQTAVADELHFDLTSRVIPELQLNFPGVRFYIDGEKKEEGELLASLARDWLIITLIIYAFMATWLRSYLTPIVVIA